MSAIELQTDAIAEAPAPVDEAAEHIQIANKLFAEFNGATRPKLVRTLTVRELNVLNHTPEQVFGMLDKNQNGSIDLGEFCRGFEVVQSAAKAQQAHEKNLNEELAKEKRKSQRRLKLLGVGAVLLAISTACNFGISVAAIQSLKEQYVSEPSTDSTTPSPFMVDSVGGVLATAKAETELSLFVAPVLSAKRLASILRLSISYMAAAGNTVWAAVDVVGIFKYSRTHVLFKLTEGGAVEVLNGEAVYREADGESHALCASTVTCSALTVDDAVDADALVAEAEAELMLANVTVAESEGRRLKPTKKECEKKMSPSPPPPSKPPSLPPPSLPPPSPPSCTCPEDHPYSSTDVRLPQSEGPALCCADSWAVNRYSQRECFPSYRIVECGPGCEECASWPFPPFPPLVPPAPPAPPRSPAWTCTCPSSHPYPSTSGNTCCKVEWSRLPGGQTHECLTGFFGPTTPCPCGAGHRCGRHRSVGD
mmetsp:Transcript_24191/g.76624  ORF Transcript_24191/g.76624 Transcript_24191/m.76624 type:complete len:479 (-) Transcript_24191:71-1507(-)